MGKGKHLLRKTMGELEKRKVDHFPRLSGLLGLPIGGAKTVEVPGRQGYVYVRLRDNTAEIIQAYNDRVSPVYDLAVIVQRDENNPSRYRVIDRDAARYSTWPSSFVPKHGNQHSFGHDVNSGGDVVWVYGRQFLPLATTPSGTMGGPNAIIQYGTYYYNNGWRSAGGTGTVDLVDYKPTDNTAKILLIYLDSNSNPAIVEGDGFDASLTGTSQIVSYIPQLPATNGIPLSAVRLVSGTTTIDWDNIYDLRPFIVGDGFIPTGSSGHVIQDEGIDLPDEIKLNFVGAAVWAIDDPINSRTNVIISGTPSHTILYEGVPLPGEPYLEFTGVNVWVVDSTGTASTQVIISGSAGHVIQDEGNTVPNQGILNFVGTNVWVQDDAGNGATKVVISGSSDAGHIIQNEGSDLSARARLNFVGTSIWAEDDPGNGATKISVSGSARHIIQNDGTSLTDYPSLNFLGRLAAYSDAGNNRTNVIASGTPITAAGITKLPVTIEFAGPNIFVEYTLPAEHMKITISGSSNGGDGWVSGTYLSSRVLFGQPDNSAGTRDDFLMITTNGPTLLVGGQAGGDPFYDEYLVTAVDPGDDRGGSFAALSYGSYSTLHAYSANGTEASPSQVTANGSVFSLAAYAYSSDAGWLGQGYLRVKARENVSSTTRGGGYWQFTMPAAGDAAAERTILELRYEEARIGNNLYVSGTASIWQAEIMDMLTVGSATNSGGRVSVIGTITDDSSLWGTCYANTNLSPQFTLRRARGTEGTPTVIQASDVLGGISFRGYNGSDFSTSRGAISCVANENWSLTNNGTRLLFYTTPDASTTIAERMRIHNNGNISINATTDDGTNKLQVNGSLYGTGLDINSDSIRIRTNKTPASATATGTAGQICWDSSYIYVCVSPNAWRRATIASW